MRKKRAARRAGKSAEAGIGSLILFIALVLVAATAAAVFIETSSSLQNKALVTAGGVQKQVATRVLIMSAWGENASNTGNIGDIYLKVKLAPGSDAFSLNSTYVGIATSRTRQTYSFLQGTACSVTNLAANPARFMVTGMIGYTKIGYLQEGDLIDVCFRIPAGYNLTADESLTVQFAPPSGTPTSFTATTPSILTDGKTLLYP